VQEHPQAIEVNVRFRSNKVIVAKVPLEQLSTDLQWHNDRLTLTPTFTWLAARSTPKRRSKRRPTPAEHDPHHDAPDQRATVAGLAELRPEDAAQPKAAPKSQNTKTRDHGKPK
jgi:hypothetical protein